jgi:hypothetical protein
LNFATISNDSLAVLIFWLCPEFWWWDTIIYFVFSVSVSRPQSLLAPRRVSVFYFLEFILSPNKLTSSA